MSVAAGAIIAGASPKDIAACETFAEKLGLAFQSTLSAAINPCFYYDFLIFSLCFIVADDILDVTSTSAELGKTVGKDVRAHKATYVTFLGLERSKSEAQRIIAEAKASISGYGERARPLLAIADYIVTRKN